jgi:hypothetical protein
VTNLKMLHTLLLLLPNHGAGIGHGSRLHLEEITDASRDAPVMVVASSSHY